MLSKNFLEKTSKNGQNNWERSQKFIIQFAIFIKE